MFNFNIEKMRKLLFLLSMITLLVSCDKEDSNSISDPIKPKNYFPLNIGNYWVYKNYEIDTLGNEKERNIADSIVITRDTIINSNQYFILEGNLFSNYSNTLRVQDILRDSSGYIVNRKGQIWFSTDNFTDTLISEVVPSNNDTLYTISYKMEKPTQQVSAPAGVFEVLNYKGTVTTPKKIPRIKNPRYMNNFYANNVGKVLASYFYSSSPNTIERRLVRYHIKTTE